MKEESIVPGEGDKKPEERDERRLLFRQLEDQYALSVKEQFNLIRSQTQITKDEVIQAVKVAKQFGLPLQGINIISAKSTGTTTIYINAEGLRWRLHVDPRGLKRSIVEVAHRPSKEEPWVETIATIEMGDGSIFSNIGAVHCPPNSPEIGNALMKCATKSLRRASVGAVGAILPIAEDFLEYLDEERQKGKKVDAIIDAEYRELKDKPIENPANLAELLAWISQTGHTVDEAGKVIKGNMQDMAGNISGTVAKLKETWG